MGNQKPLLPFWVVILVILAVLWVRYKDPRYKDGTPRVRVGETARIASGRWQPNSRGVLVAATKEVHNERFNTLKALDIDGYQQFLASGKAYSVDAGTKARVIEISGTRNSTVTPLAMQVRILEGEHEEKTGWLPAAHVKVCRRVFLLAGRNSCDQFGPPEERNDDGRLPD